MNPTALASKYRQPLTGLIGTVLVLSIAALGLQAAGGAYADDYTLTAVVDRAGFGVNTKSTVKVRGITVGNVGNVELVDDGSVEITMNIRKDARIPESVLASVEPLSLFGPKYVNLILGAGEGVGPYLDDGAVITNTDTSVEVIESLEQISTLVNAIDEEDLASILTEFGRGFDGLGETFGEVIDNSSFVADRALANRAIVDQLLRDARTITAVFEDRGDDFATTLDDAARLLDTFSQNGDAVSQLLLGTSQLSSQLSDVVRAGGDDLDAVVRVLDPVTEVLFAQLAEVPDLLLMTEEIFAFLADNFAAWDRPDGRAGAVVTADIVLDPCFQLPIC